MMLHPQSLHASVGKDVTDVTQVTHAFCIEFYRLEASEQALDKIPLSLEMTEKINLNFHEATILSLIEPMQ